MKIIILLTMIDFFILNYLDSLGLFNSTFLYLATITVLLLILNLAILYLLDSGSTFKFGFFKNFKFNKLIKFKNDI